MTSSDKLQGGQPAPLATLHDAVKAHDWEAAQAILGASDSGCIIPGCTLTKGAHARTYLELEAESGPRTADDFAWRHRWGEP